jgi:uroporphyrinogen decarboxylase
VLEDISEVYDLAVPSVGVARSGIFVEGTKKAKELMPDKPVFCGAIGPFSLACRLFDMTSLMMECYDSPEEVCELLKKTAAFITEFIKAHKAAGADGVLIAEPAAGLLSPDMCEEFSSVFIRQIVEDVADDDFVFCYHNCGGSVVACAESIADVGADIYHFGNAIRLADIIEKMPADSIVMGNVDPVLLREGDPEAVRAAVDAVFAECKGYDNFMLSTGCDLPAGAKWENIDAFFARVGELYVQG